MQFKKTLLATSALMAAAAWAPQAHAIPAFARQVGMPCSACHYQHFPTLNSFGRSFKAAGFTMVGSEEKIEGDGLSIPAVLNLAFVTNLAYTKTNGPSTANPSGAGTATSAVNKGTNNGQFTMTQYSLFMGGRVGTNIGFEGEVGLTGGNGGANLASVKMPFSYDVAGGKLDVIPFTTDGLGPQQGFEALSDGASPVHLFNQEDMGAIGAYEYVSGATNGGNIPAYGAALVYYTDMGYVNFTKWSPDSISGVHNAPAGDPGGSSAGGAPTSNYLRAVWTPGDVAGFDTAVGIQYMNGTSTASAASGLTAGVYKTRMTEIDGQMLGDFKGMPLTLIASYATAPAETVAGAAIAAGANGASLFNPGTATRKSFNIGAELGVIPNKATLQLGIRRASSGAQIVGGALGSNATDNAIMVGATYNIALNVRAELTYSKYSGDTYNAAAQAAGTAANTYAGDNMTTINLWMGF